MRSVLAGCALFFSGAATALLADHLLLLHHRPHAASTVTGVAPSFADIDSAVHLTPVQRDSVRSIFARHQQEIDSAWRQINRGVMSTMDSVHAALIGVLTPEQLLRLHALMRERHGISAAPHEP